MKGCESFSIKSPGYSQSSNEKYPNNYYHLWDIQAPLGFLIKVIVRSLDIENGGDYVFMENGPDQFTNKGSASWISWTGQIINNLLASMDFTTNASSARVIFTSDYRTSKSGFWFQLQAIEGDTNFFGDFSTVSLCNLMCTQDFNSPYL